MISNRMVLTLSMAAAVISLSMAVAEAQTRLIFASESPAGTPNSVFYSSVAKKITDDSQGTLNVELRDGETLANVANAYDRVSDDVIQIGWLLHSLVGNRFPRSEVSGLPFIGDNNIACSVASWKLYESGLLDAEYKDVVPIWFGCLATSYLHWAKVPSDTDSMLKNGDLHGAKFRVNGKIPGEVVRLLNGTPASMAPAEMYEGLQRGIINGVVTSWAGFDPYKLVEVTDYHVEAPIASTASMHFMSRKKFDSLPKQAQDAIMKNGGIAGSIEMAKFINRAVDRARTGVINAKQQIVKLTPEQNKTWEEKTATAKQGWVNATPDGDKVLAAFVKFYKEAEGSGQ